MRDDSVPAMVRLCSCLFLAPAPSPTPHLKIILGENYYYFQDCELSEQTKFKIHYSHDAKKCKNWGNSCALLCGHWHPSTDLSCDGYL